MRVVALISGGKDSCYNMMQCVSEGHDIVALANLHPKDKDELDSYMYQTVGHHAIDLYAEAMDLPLFRRVIQGTSKQIGKYYSPDTNDEVEDLYELLHSIKKEIDFDAVSSGAILSDYQRVRVENVCERLGLVSLAFLWRRNQQQLMREMIDCGLNAVIIKVAALGLDPKKHLGRTLAEMYAHMLKMDKEYGLHICGEGGEFETFTLDCPLFKKKLVIEEAETVIHSEDAFAPVAYLNLKKLHLEDKPEMRCSITELLHTLPMKRGRDLLSELFTEEERKEIESDLSEYDRNDKEPGVIKTQEEETFDEVAMVSKHQGNKWFHVTGLVGQRRQGETTEDVTRRVMERLKNAVCELGREMGDLVSVCLSVHDMGEYNRINPVYNSYFSNNPPVRVCVQGASAPNIVLTVNCVGCVPEEGKVKDTMHVQGISHWAPSNIGPYSQAVQVHNTLVIAGMIGLCPASMKIVSGGIVPQARLSLRHVRRVLSAMHAGSKMSDLTLVICYLTSVDYIHHAVEEWRHYLSTEEETSYGEESAAHVPLLQCVVVPGLPRDSLVEWQSYAYTGSDTLTDHRIETSIGEKGRIRMEYCYSRVEDTSVFSSKTTLVHKEGHVSVYEESVRAVVALYSQVLGKLSLTWQSVNTWRVFYPASLIQYTELHTVLLKELKGLSEQAPVVALTPVTSLGSDTEILSICTS